jgi:hypothetical protein
LTAGGGLYKAPVATATAPANILLNATDGVTNNAHLEFSEAELGDAMKNPLPEPDADLRLSPTVKVNSLALVSPPANPADRTITLVPLATGGFSGKFTLADARDMGVTIGNIHPTRTAAYAGMVVFESGTPKGYGYFLLARRPTTNVEAASPTAQLSGKVEFTKTH